ncbi:MAG: NUMOD4 domain-containing protein [Deltaproteobacteria bacterium]|nr:NUMOD4 domain-containing protein [Deltaproteobacteria bacterium]
MSKREEEWRDVRGFEKRYQVSDLGRVRSLDRTLTDALGRTRRLVGRVLAQEVGTNGYLGVHLVKGVRRLVHRLVAIAFLPGGRDLQVNHKSGVRSENAATNLEWLTCSDNHQHSYRELSRKQHAKTAPVVVGGVWYPSGLAAAQALHVNAGSIQSALTRGHRCRGMEVCYG